MAGGDLRVSEGGLGGLAQLQKSQGIGDVCTTLSLSLIHI